MLQSSHQKSLPQTVFCVRETAAIFKPSTASCLPAIRLIRVTHFGQHFLACRLTQSLPQTLFILRETLGKWIQAYTAQLPHLAHSQHTRHTWPTCSTLAPLDLGRWEGSGSSVASASQVGQMRRKWVLCVARASVSSGSSVLQVGQVVAIA